MPFWFFRRRPRYVVAGAPPEHLLITEEALRRHVEDLFVVREQELRGHGFAWGGELLMEPARALRLLEARFKPYGYTPFLGRERGAVWIQALPLASVELPSRPQVNVVLFLLTCLSTLAAGCLVAGSFPFVTFNPFVQPAQLLAGVPFAFTLLAILGTHEFGHYFTARYYGASVSLPYFIPAPPPIFLFGTLGAVIRMRSPARDRNSLFDIAVAGPLAGLVVAIP
ncbi:MAG TPA: site-2 protease family protein, partial [Methylomirabilota bacterium]|nr:site-2 protease family protein [Methylomirabilota bacterium]